MKKTLFTIALISTLSLSTLQAQQHQKPFLIQQGLPHYTKILKKQWNDKELALTPKQKKALIKIRKETITKLQSLKQQINKLQKEIINASKKGVQPNKLKTKVNKLAKLRAQATMTHLRCIYKTKKILTPKQLKKIQLH